ncbi:DNA replication initiation control protein YabA [Aneurinibacillus terranovensis]|uniref:DNA replication initiation control protein YabA n=1 Tax=Aneurinibacillus terranovensis TaxID=278991 RepID=UPI0004286257|nr:DNA replication initiation control protein YabA [Aneurinibacillus terranovensis]
MDKQGIFQQVALIEEQVGRLHQEVGQLKATVIGLLEENKNLVIENQHLRNRLQEKEVDKDEPNKREASQPKNSKEKRQPVGEGYDNLARLYQEGFHICNLHYGSLRTEGDCLFCLSFLNKE